MESIEKERIHALNGFDYSRGNYVLYWMQSSHRVQYNHSLFCACSLANKLKLPLLVFFGLHIGNPCYNRRNLQFLLEGLAETSEELRRKNIKMVVWMIDPVEGIINLAENASAVVTDFSYLKTSEDLTFRAAKSIKTRFIAVESDVVVPVRIASFKEEYAASSFRPKILKLINLYLNDLKAVNVNLSSLDFKFKGINLASLDSIIEKFEPVRKISPVDSLKGGNSNAVKILKSFINRKLDDYPEKRNHPSLDFSSHLSPYLHFGQISPVYIAKKILATESPGRDVFLEELIIRRELSFNFVYYNKYYDKFSSLSGWAMETLLKHESDPREYIYTKFEFEHACTHDDYWNAAQNELVTTGKIHNYMRMYWGKKIIEWTEGPDVAFEYMVYLNNKYALDGNDPNSYSGIAWCLGKHDRPWGERAIFGKVRYMNDKGLKRKFDMEPYLKKYGNKN